MNGVHQKRKRDIDQSLIRRTAKPSLVAAEFLHKRAIHDNVRLRDQGIPLRTMRIDQLLKRPAGVRHDIQPKPMAFPRNGQKFFRLQEWLASGKRDAGEKRILSDLLQDLLGTHERPALKTLRLRIMAARAMMRAPLRKDHEADPRSVRDRFLNKSGNSNHFVFFP